MRIELIWSKFGRPYLIDVDADAMAAVSEDGVAFSWRVGGSSRAWIVPGPVVSAIVAAGAPSVPPDWLLIGRAAHPGIPPVLKTFALFPGAPLDL